VLAFNDAVFHAKIEVPRHFSKKNSRPIFFNRKTGKRFLGKDLALSQAEDTLVSTLRQKARAQGITEPIGYDLHVRFLFFFDNYFTKSNARNKKIGDLSNLYLFPEDCLQKASIIENDSLICSHDGSRRMPSQNGKSYLEIYIYRYP